jgi:hypothetical protein
VKNDFSRGIGEEVPALDYGEGVGGERAQKPGQPLEDETEVEARGGEDGIGAVAGLTFLTPPFAALASNNPRGAFAMVELLGHDDRISGAREGDAIDLACKAART